VLPHEVNILKEENKNNPNQQRPYQRPIQSTVIENVQPITEQEIRQPRAAPNWKRPSMSENDVELLKIGKAEAEKNLENANKLFTETLNSLIKSAKNVKEIKEISVKGETPSLKKKLEVAVQLNKDYDRKLNEIGGEERKLKNEIAAASSTLNDHYRRVNHFIEVDNSNQIIEHNTNNNPNQTFDANPNANPNQTFDANPNANPNQTFDANPNANPNQTFDANPNANPNQTFDANPNANPNQTFDANPNANPNQTFDANPNANPNQTFDANPNANPKQTSHPISIIDDYEESFFQAAEAEQNRSEDEAFEDSQEDNDNQVVNNVQPESGEGSTVVDVSSESFRCKTRLLELYKLFDKKTKLKEKIEGELGKRNEKVHNFYKVEYEEITKNIRDTKEKIELIERFVKSKDGTDTVDFSDHKIIVDGIKFSLEQSDSLKNQIGKAKLKINAGRVPDVSLEDLKQEAARVRRSLKSFAIENAKMLQAVTESDIFNDHHKSIARLALKKKF
jgi:hypothetical protein